MPAEPRRCVRGAALAISTPAPGAEQLSGGERRRVALAALLRGDSRPAAARRADQPPRHRGDRLAGRHLRPSYGKAFVVVTHDRWFLDEVCERTWEVAGGQVHSYEGGYSAYVLARAERARQAAAQDQRRRNLLRKELAWLRRGPPGQDQQAQVPDRGRQAR